MRINRFARDLAVIVGVLLAPWYWDQSLLIGLGIMALVYAILDIERALRVTPVPLAHLTFIIGGLQLVIAPWLTQYYPDTNPANQIPPGAIGTYMDFAVPATLAFGMGLALAMFWFFRVKSRAETGWMMPLDPRSERSIQQLFGLSFALLVLGPSLPVPGVLAFFVLLLSEIVLVCPLLLFFGGKSYWWKLALLPLAWKLLGSIGSTSFHTLILWLAVYVMAYWSVRFRGRNFRYVVVAGLLGVMILQPAKTFFREQGGGVLGFGTVLIQYLSNPLVAYSDANLSRTLMRMNQGWILYRVMVWVPQNEPYGGTALLERQLMGVLLPRFLAPDKYKVGGAEHFEQYTGHQLFGGTSMGLGYTGEFYAAFGYGGGILAIWVYGLLLGAALARLRLAAWRNPFWHAWGPFMFLVAVKAEDSVGNAVNWAVKAWVVVMLVRYGFQRLFKRRRLSLLEPGPEHPGRSDGRRIEEPLPGRTWR